MSYVSLYRKYRSQTFGDLIGQDHVVRTLQNAIKSERIAHSYLFTGPRGTGKTSTARLLAKALCCVNGPTPEPDNSCDICREITTGSCIDVIEMDAASESGVDQIRENIVETVEYQPMVCRFKVYIIDEVHDLSRSAFDALLKTIEEPPPHIKFILATTEFNKVPPTIRSRCQKFEFHRATLANLVSRLEYVTESEGFSAEPAALAALARMADGGYRDALTLLEQAILTADGKITLEQVYDQLGLVSEEVVDALLIAIREQNVPRIMDLLSEVSRLGRDPRSVVESMLYRLQDLTRMVYQTEPPPTDAPRGAATHETAVRLGRDVVLRLRSQLADAHRVIRDITIPRLWLESELVRLSTQSSIANPQGEKYRDADASVRGSSERAASKETVATAPIKGSPLKAAPVKEASQTPPLDVPDARAVASVSSSNAESKPLEETAHSESFPDDVSSEVQRLWENILLGFPDETPHARKLKGTKAIGIADGVLTVGTSRAMDLEWFTENPKRAGYMKKVACERAGIDLNLRFVLAKGESASRDDGAVEFPAEGPRLEQLAREIFGQN